MAFSVLITKTPKASLFYKRARYFVDKYEIKTTNSELIKRAKEEVTEYISDIKTLPEHYYYS